MREKNSLKIILSAILLVAGYLLLITGPFPIRFFSLFVTGSLAFLLTFGKKGIVLLFQKPEITIKKFAKVVMNSVVIAYFWISIIAFLLILIPNASFKGENELIFSAFFLFGIMPFAVMGEELFTILIVRVIQLQIDQFWVASLIASLIFGLAHFTTYYNGSIFFATLHILFIQGGARFIFNDAYQKTGTIWGSWLTHYLFNLAVSFL
ncbi:MAG: hypothetical protein IC227_01950 [Enterococcus lacertideformus]|uniref:CAAX prenyl protease 2/Lysostaphin resistance protein A-like domain-containing protein n=1 Tax=Enterococcus lacertideformus TaxID=2771493 RepID=A0A931B173_9ENTE|nr:hypothetical protein [Enterococcus lacertideformus]